MKKLCILCLLLCAVLATACGKPQTPEKNIKLRGQTEAVYYTVKAPVDGEIRGLILEPGERIRKSQPLFGLGTQDKDPGVEKAAAELARAQARLNNASRENSEATRASSAAALQNARERVQSAAGNHEKMQRLYTIGGTSRVKLQQAKEELDTANAALAAARARFDQVSRTYTPEELAALKQQVEQARASYDAAVLTVEGSEVASPATGIVKDILAKNGETVKKGQAVIRLTASTDCTIPVSLSVADPRFTEGMEASITAAGNKKSFPAVIRRAEPDKLVLFSNQKPEELPEGTTVEISINIK